MQHPNHALKKDAVQTAWATPAKVRATTVQAEPVSIDFGAGPSRSLRHGRRRKRTEEEETELTTYLTCPQPHPQMPPKRSGRKALPAQFRGVSMRFAHKTCLRCLKRIFDDPIHRCGYKDLQKCEACIRKHKECGAVGAMKEWTM